MTDHIARMVHGFLARARNARTEGEATTHLIDAIHRMIREAERETQRRCVEIASSAVGPERSDQVAHAIAALAREGTLPRRELRD